MREDDQQPATLVNTTDACPVTVAYGDGIGPEIMDAVLRILSEARVKLAIETIQIGQEQYRLGNPTGIPPYAWDSIRRTKLLLKAPMTTPQGKGYKSVNVTLRRMLGLAANVRPVRSYHPWVPCAHTGMDMVIIRENEADLYTGIEHRHTPEVYQSLKLYTRAGCERIVRYAFDYAQHHGRKKVTCMSKDNIMKLTDGLLHQVFDTVAVEYPDIEHEHYIIDIGAARVASRPEQFDVVVTSNLYGDILSDIAAEVSASVGLAGSSNIGEDYAMFEAVHGSAPDIAGQDIANPSGLLMGALMLLEHVGYDVQAHTIRQAWHRTLEDGVHTADMYGNHSTEKVGCQAFADAVIARLGEVPTHARTEDVPSPGTSSASVRIMPLAGATTSNAKEGEPSARTLVGVDIFVHTNQAPDDLAAAVQRVYSGALALQHIRRMGLVVWPVAPLVAGSGDVVCCRFKVSPESQKTGITAADIVELLQTLQQEHIEFVKMEHLYHFGDTPGFSAAQGE